MPTEAPKRRLRAPERRALIVEAALEEFATHGYEAASMGRIGQAAGVTRPVLYDHFGSKRALYAALLEDKQAVLMDRLREATDARATMEVRMRATFDAFFRFAEEDPLAWRLLHPERAPDDPGAAGDHRRCRSEAGRQFAQMIAPDARRAGMDPKSPIGQAVFVLQQAGIQGAIRWWHAHPDVTREEMTEAAVNALWDGLGGLSGARPTSSRAAAGRR
jgi:AcrR family transcriptional regulator